MFVRIILASALALPFALATPSAQATPEFKCNKKLRPKKVLVGYRGQYEIKRGLAVQKRYGFLGRKKLKPAKKCFFGGLKSDQCVVMHFNKKAFDKMGGHLKVQCVLSDKPGEMIDGRNKGALGYSMDAIDGYEIVLYGKNKTGYKSSSEDNSARSIKLKKSLAKKHLVMKSFCVPRAQTKFAKAIGKKIFCQWFHEKSGTVAFATEYLFEGPKK